MSDATRPPVATGNLARTPFAHLVLYLFQRRASGTLIATAAGSTAIKVLFHRGRAVAAHFADPGLALDQGLMPLAAASEGDFEFHETDLVGTGAGIVTGMFDPFAFVTECSRRHAREETVAEVLGRYQDVPLALDPSMDLTRLGLTADEARFASPLTRGPFTLEALCTQGHLPLPAARRLLYTLLITRTVGPHQPTDTAERTSQPNATQGNKPKEERSTSDASRPVGPLSDRSERLRPSGEAWRAIASRAAEMAENRSSGQPSRSLRAREPSQPQPMAAARPSHPGNVGRQSSARVVETPLSVSPDATGTQRAGSDSRPLSRAKSRPITPGLGSMNAGRPVSRPISRPLTPSPHRESSQDLKERVTPSGPLNRVTPRPSQPDVETLDTAGKVKRVELLCQRNAYDDALPIVRTLIEEDRKNPKYLGLLAHVLYGRTTDGTIGKEIIEAVNQSLRIDPDQVHALYTKARCYKRLGKEREALHYFRRTVSVEPGHLDAAREVRLLMLRMNEKRKR